MIVDCMACPVRGRRCEDCAVMVLIATPGAGHRPLAGVPQGELRSAAAPRRPHEPRWTPEVRWNAELRLDAAEHEAVSMFVGAGLVSADVAGGLRARLESVQERGITRHVG